MEDNSISPTEQNNVLEMRGITKLYAGTVALENVSFTVVGGEVHGLIGKNGAGKSTLVGILSGIIPPSRGTIHLNGNTYHHLTPITAKKEHVAIITQEPQVVEESTVAENLFMPRYIDSRSLVKWRKIDQEAKELLKRTGFEIHTDRKVRELTVSERQILLVVKACYVEDARIIIMDEVSASLNQKDQLVLYRIIQDQVDSGKTVIFISHHTEELLNVCDRVTVLRNGHSVGSAKVQDLDKKKLAALIVGDEAYEASVAEEKSALIENESILELRDYTRYGKFEKIDLCIKKGEVVGLAGLRGSGRTELFKCLVGLDQPDQGEVLLDGKAFTVKSPDEAMKSGMVYLAEEREAEGLVSISSIKRNITVNILPEVSRNGVILSRLENSRADRLVKVMDIVAASRDQLISQLSGGNKQKVLVGKIMAGRPRVSLLDEPTRGVDIEAKQSILKTINDEMRKDSCVLITSPGVDDLIKICDRILILYRGRLIDTFNREEFDEEVIYRAIQGEVIHEETVREEIIFNEGGQSNATCY